MTKHTPGPWTVSPLGSEEEGTLVLWVTKRGGICRLYDHASYGDGENRANAALIATAPDLLEALRELADCLNVLNPNRRLVTALREARASIAKAQEER